ncbi:hypothetical protein CIRG_07798 [Coccidioides immitis RMSCC 2394]|uniref:Uncharacterized protein n=1 Tax=Coccidioides immitis RMSCC 2394 TaxID=404692 RepID=A0A0J7BDE8_COCIT|nr:hypothetical protein CIRG_07798 [Coccidioides immitis RMSCC 2394]
MENDRSSLCHPRDSSSYHNIFKAPKNQIQSTAQIVHNVKRIPFSTPWDTLELSEARTSVISLRIPRLLIHFTGLNSLPRNPDSMVRLQDDPANDELRRIRPY